MKSLISILLIFVLGDCIMLTKGVFKGSYWTIISVNEDNTYDLKDKTWVLPHVRESYLEYSDRGQCRDN